MRDIAASSCSPQSHRMLWKMSPVKHSECTRTMVGVSGSMSPSVNATCSAASTTLLYAMHLNTPQGVGIFVSTTRLTKDSRLRRKEMMSAMDTIGMSCAADSFRNCGRRAIVPSAFMISHTTAADCLPATRTRSIDPSVCPARTSTPPSW